jgi:hypothetical protein
MNKKVLDSSPHYLSISRITSYQHCSTSDQKANKEIKEKIKRIGKDALEGTHRFDLGFAAHRRQPTPPPSRSSWWPMPPPPDSCTYATTTTAFGPSMLTGVGAALVPFPLLVGVLTDRALRPRCLTVESSRPVVYHPRLGTMP